MDMKDFSSMSAKVRHGATRILDGHSSERWTSEQVRFAEEARIAARKVYYYARMLDPGMEGEWHDFILRRMAGELRAVNVPTQAECTTSAGSGSEDDFKGVRKPFKTLIEQWSRMQSLAGVSALPWQSEWGVERALSEQDPAGRIHQVEEAVVQFLHDSIPKTRSLRVTYARIPAIISLLRQHFAFLLSAMGVAVLLGSIEAVHSLYVNDWLPSAFIVLSVAVVPFAVYAVGQLRRRAKRVVPWDRGGRVHRSIKPHVLQPAPWRSRHPTEAESVRVFRGRGIGLGVLAVGWTLVGLGVFGLQVLRVIDPVAVTVYVITVILCGILVLGTTLDFLDIHSQPPIRRSLLVGLLAYGAGIVLFDSAAIGIWILILVATVLVYWAYRISFGPVVWVYGAMIVVVAIQLTLTYQRRGLEIWAAPPHADAVFPVDSMIGPDLWPAGQAAKDPPPVVVIAASGGGSRAAIYTALTLEALQRDHPDVLSNLQAIGSVSGGSLANATYLADRLRTVGGADLLPCSDSLSTRMAGDFLFPVLKGVLPFVGRGRGRSIQQHWESCPVGLGADIRLSTAASEWRKQVSTDPAGPPPFPIPLFHSASLLRHAVVLSPLRKEMYAPSAIEHEARSELNAYRSLDAPTWVFYRAGIYGLDDLLPGYDPSLSQTVRASANFPFGFPLVEIDSKEPLYLSPFPEHHDAESTKRVRLTDGGALSNSGVWALYHLLVNQAEALRERGVLLILLDASAMPARAAPNRVTGLVRTILDKNPKGEFLHRVLLRGLAATYGGCFDAVEFEIRAGDEWNVHTTWALDGQSVQRVREAFHEEWAGTSNPAKTAEGKRIGDAFRALQTCDPEGEPRWTGASRVPLS